MKVYFSYFKLMLARGMQYKIAAIAGVVTQFFFGIMYLLVYKAFYEATATTVDINYPELSTYVWLGQIFFAMLFVALKDRDIFTMIKNGNVAYELCRPINIYYFWFAKAMARRLASTLLRVLPTLIVCIFIIPYPYNLGAPASVFSLILFIITLFLGLVIICEIVNLVHISVFFTLDDTGITSIMLTIVDFFAGSIVPIPFLPDIFQKIAYILPFRLTFDLPLRTYIGNIPVIEALQSIGLQIIWILAFLWLGNFIMKKITNKVVIQGG